MPTTDELFLSRKSLDQICTVPEKIISVYSLEQHVWADSNSPDSRRSRKAELKTIEEFQIDPVRPFLNDVLRNMGAPYSPSKRDNPIGQGYWIQAEFGSGKSHLLCFLSALALGGEGAWNLVQEKEKAAGKGKRESLFQFWEGIKAKGAQGKKGIFVIVKTLVGVGSGGVGLGDTGRDLTDYILDAAKEQLEIELGRNISLYPAEALADRFLADDVDRYRADLKKFLRDPNYFDDDEMEDVNDFIRDIQQNKSPEYKRSAGNKLWRFYTEYLKVQPQIDIEPEDVLKHMVEGILAEGYSGVLLVLDEVSLFMRNRPDQRGEDEQTLVVLSNRLAKVHNLPIWTICSAQQALEATMGVKNIIADDRLKLVKLLEKDTDYYDIVLARVREIVDPGAIGNYYLYYKRGFTWPNSVGETEFTHFFPFHKPALEVLRAITYELTTTRSAIHFMHQTLRHQIRHKGNELIRLWELFDEAVQYEEDPSGVHAGLVAVKTKRETEYRAYEACRRQIEGQTKGILKVHRDKAIKTVQTLFLYEVSRTRQQGLTPEEIANSVMIPRQDDSSPEENIQHYETVCETLKKELRQVAHRVGEGQKPLYRFDPVVTGVDPRAEFQKARDAAEGSEVLKEKAWLQLLGLSELPVKTRQITIDMASGVRSIFREIAPRTQAQTLWGAEDQTLEIVWNGRKIQGKVGMRDFGRLASEPQGLPQLKTDETEDDYAFIIGTHPVGHEVVEKLLEARKDPRIITWSPGDLTAEEKDRLVDFAGYLKLMDDWAGKETEDAQAIITWVANALQADMGRIYKSVEGAYSRGRVDALNNAQMQFHVAGELVAIVTPLVDRVLSGVYVSSDVHFEGFEFRREEAVKVINGIVKTGSIPRGAKPNQNISAAQNFGFGLGIMKKSAERELDVSDNVYVRDMMAFIEQKLAQGGQSISVQSLYKNFMGIGGPRDYGLSKRMVQLYLLCLVRQARVRVGLGPRSGLPFQAIDYSNIADIEFSAKVLDAFTDVQRMEPPEDWEALRAYAEILLGRTIPAGATDSAIGECRKELRDLFGREEGEAERTVARANALFERLGMPVPYEEDIRRVACLFATDLTGADDIHTLLRGLEQCFGYKAFDSSASSQVEVDDLANRLRCYRNMQRFLDFESEIRAAAEYVRHAIPDTESLRPIQEAQHVLAEKLARIVSFVDSEVALRTELIGKLPADPAERGTFGALRRDYATAYISLHDHVQEHVDTVRQALSGLEDDPAFKAVQALDGAHALGEPVADGIRAEVERQGAGLTICRDPSRASIEANLASGPACSCGLTFANGGSRIDDANKALRALHEEIERALMSKAGVLLTETAQERLKQGQADPAISRLLGVRDATALVPILVEIARATPDVGERIGRYLKKLVVRHVDLRRFKPSRATIGREQVPETVDEFRAFLETELRKEEGDDVVPMLQLE